MEVKYQECNGLQTRCPYNKKEALYNSLTSKTPSGFGDIFVGSLSCKRCKHYLGEGNYSLKSGNSWYFSIKCNCTKIMKPNHHELTLQLWNLLTKEEIEKGEASITYDCGIATDIKVGSSMVDKLLEKSPWRDHIIGFKRNGPFIDLLLDEEGQSKWDAKENEIQAWCNKYGCD